MGSIRFESIFGVREQEVKKICLLIPFINKDILNYLGINKVNKGWLYSSANTKYFTLIHTKIGTSFVGDAVLWLNNTHCQYLFFLGTCGLVSKRQEFDIGELIFPSSSWGMESFSQMLKGELHLAQKSTPDTMLLKTIKKYLKDSEAHTAVCATLGSLQIEEALIPFFQERHVEIVDMETSAFFNASRHIKRKAAAVLVVSDILKEKPFYEKQDAIYKEYVKISLQKGAAAITAFAKDMLSSCH